MIDAILSAGIAVGRDGTVYFVDGTIIRKIKDGIISTVVGSHSQIGPARLPKCSDSMSFDQVKKVKTFYQSAKRCWPKKKNPKNMYHRRPKEWEHLL